MITIQELLYNRGLERTARVKLVRHKDRRLDLYNMYRTDRRAFLEYQNTQSKDIFKGVDYIVSFIGEEGVLARFVGVYRIDGRTNNNGSYVYSMTEVEGYEDLKERVIIRWENAISWHQWIKNEMEILEISPGLHYKRFTDYFELILDFAELQEIVINQYADWRRVLSAVKGVYLINDTHTGKLYIGSAYGEDGLWGRWSEYVSTNGHGGNKALKALIDEDWEYACKHFQFSILMLLPKTVTPDEAVRKEQLFKRKLGTNSFGLNNN
ncbi:MAG: GIY-YIG nuclease family protein [Alistipes sp.]|nr:GIY-YIG nuclease family protein [Rikenellaceae bacterium]MBQ6939859.1 GIY-YIG nuclease family protein [Alistipes sp.]MBQ8853993.1 GIY-YIG nuclease family protein [Alistipes sp.]